MYSLLFDINHTVFTLWDYPVSGLELWATLITLVSVVLARMNNKHNFTTGIIGCIGFGMLFWQIQLYSDYLLQYFFIVVSYYGYFRWSREDRNAQGAPNSLVFNEQLGVLAVIIFGTIFLGQNIDTLINGLATFINPDYIHIPADLPYRDAFTTVTSITAFMLLVYRFKETWLCWIAVNVVCIANYLSQGVILLTIEYGIFLLNAIWGYYQWGNTTSNQSK